MLAPQKITMPHILVVIGASAFGPPLVNDLLTRLAAAKHLAIFLIQHGFDENQLRRAYENKQPFPLGFPADGDLISSGSVYTVANGHHLAIGYSNQPGSTGCQGFMIRKTLTVGLFPFCPAIDVTMATAAQAAGSSVVGVLVSGFSYGHDGSLGGMAIRERKGRVFGGVEGDKEPGLVRDAVNSGSVDKLLPIKEIAEQILKLDSISQGLRIKTSPVFNDDRRQHLRLSLPFAVILERCDDAAFRDRGTALDISAGGLLYQHQRSGSELMAAGQRVMVHLLYPGAGETRPVLSQRGCVVRADSTGNLPGLVAVKFDSEISFGHLIRPV